MHGAEVTNISKTLLMLALVCIQKRPDVPPLVYITYNYNSLLYFMGNKVSYN